MTLSLVLLLALVFYVFETREHSITGYLTATLEFEIMPGRGGAGNILNLQQRDKRITQDLEANQQAAEQLTIATPSADAILSRDQQKYAYTGRGGAGNWYSPQQLVETGTYDDTLPVQAASHSSEGFAVACQQAAAEPVRRYGRGGAGNMSFGVSEYQERAIQKRMQDEEQKREKVKADVESEVNAMLPEPPKAKLSGSAPGTGADPLGNG